MEFKKGSIKLERELSELDNAVIQFKSRLQKLDIDYVVISGYVAILLGRPRGSENVDILIDLEDKEEFERLWQNLSDRYWCSNAGEDETWNMLQDKMSIRFAEQGTAIPNFEIMLPQDEFDHVALNNSLNAFLDHEKINISPLELQIAYKLYLGSEKDFEDALHIYKIAKENLNEARLNDHLRALEVGDEAAELESEAEKGN